MNPGPEPTSNTAGNRLLISYRVSTIRKKRSDTKIEYKVDKPITYPPCLLLLHPSRNQSIDFAPVT